MKNIQNLNEQINFFLATKPNATKGTLTAYTSDLKTFVDWYIDNKEKYADDCIYRAFSNEIMTQPLSPNTKRRRKTIVGEFLVFLKIYPKDYVVIRSDKKTWYFSKDEYTIINNKTE